MKALFLIFHGFQEATGLVKKSDTKFMLSKQTEWKPISAIYQMNTELNVV